MLQLLNQLHSSHSTKSRASCQQTKQRIMVRNLQLKSKPKKIRPRRKIRVSLLFQKEVGSAQNARITTSKAEIIATDAKKKKMMRITLESQNICLKLNSQRNKRNQPRLRKMQLIKLNQLTPNPRWSSQINGLITQIIELQRKRNSKKIR